MFCRNKAYQLALYTSQNWYGYAFAARTFFSLAGMSCCSLGTTPKPSKKKSKSRWLMNSLTNSDSIARENSLTVGIRNLRSSFASIDVVYLSMEAGGLLADMVIDSQNQRLPRLFVYSSIRLGGGTNSTLCSSIRNRSKQIDEQKNGNFCYLFAYS